MSLEDYFPYYKHKELSPITITKEEKEGKFYFVLKDKDGISVEDSRLFEEEKLNKESEKIVKFLTERDYIINDAQ